MASGGGQLSDQEYNQPDWSKIPLEDQPQSIRDHNRRRLFFFLLFGEHEGLLCIAAKTPTGQFRESFFKYPEDLDTALNTARQWMVAANVYFCVNLLDKPQRIKENVRQCQHIWADLDTADPAHMLVPPSIVVESSPGRWHAYWLFHEPQDVVETELLARRIAYYHKDEGADTSGWDMVQLLRVPLTSNFNYDFPHPRVKLIHSEDTRYTPYSFKDYPRTDQELVEFRQQKDLPDKSATEILQKYRGIAADVVWHLYAGIPDEDWSKALWQLETNLAEAGLAEEETFIVARESGCNKYARDQRGDEALWKEVQKAHAWVNTQKDVYQLRHQELSVLLDDGERSTYDGFIERYIGWASNQTDAAPIYHEASAFLVLSTVLSRAVRIPTRFNPEGMVPNLWFMILGDTTLTRKSTAMNMGIDMLLKIMPEAFTATDATIEGLLLGLSARGGEPAVFVRDEFAGMLAAIQKKDYYAGMLETLTQLYDGRTIKRRLAKSQIDVIDPVFIMFCGGIRDNILALMTTEVIASGFAPRFLYFSADTDLGRIEDLGPPVDESWHGREELLDFLRKLNDKYDAYETVIFDAEEHSIKRTFKAAITPEAWQRHAELTRVLRKDGMESADPKIFTPIYERLGISILKASVLLAAAREENPMDDKVVVTLSDMLHATQYGEGWRDTSVQMIANAGATAFEKQLRAVFERIRKEPGIPRSTLMRTFSLHSKDAAGIFETLEQRGLVRQDKVGKKLKYWPEAEKM
jgi:hypothetical protein